MRTFIYSAIFLVSGAANAFVVNPGLDGSTAGWVATGQAGVQSVDVYAGTDSGWVGTVDFDGDDINDYTSDAATVDISDNALTQTVSLANPSFSEIQFHYNFYTRDYDGYDEPGFQILVDGISVFAIDAADLGGDGTTVETTGWQTFVLDLSGYSGSIDIEINAGNGTDNDDLYQSWAFVELTNVPIPASVWLLGSAIFGLAGFTRRRR